MGADPVSQDSWLAEKTAGMWQFQLHQDQSFKGKILRITTHSEFEAILSGRVFLGVIVWTGNLDPGRKGPAGRGCCHLAGESQRGPHSQSPQCCADGTPCASLGRDGIFGRDGEVSDVL